ncbi:hypothetical protein BLNAU_5823 [Blattamonas nauphoetae]|uniref:Uncharacterized protein n=1 Tax=Blattamonas nauphoetae TaxID=2049346 RepID=A0ABQ9Y690_9EUKA|nr:hypothetical protein BLNAU_5823 [Blattamonas nauphoetae]
MPKTGRKLFYSVFIANTGGMRRLFNQTWKNKADLPIGAIFANVFFVLKHVVHAILCALFTLDPGTQQPIIAHAVSRGHIVGRSITTIISRLFNKPTVHFALKSVKTVFMQRSFDFVDIQILNAHLPLRLSLFANSPTVPA